jgi:hypothetical protein
MYVIQIWLQAFRFPTVDRVFRYFDLTTEVPQYKPSDADPLKVYLTKKLRTHGNRTTPSLFGRECCMTDASL